MNIELLKESARTFKDTVDMEIKELKIALLLSCENDINKVEQYKQKAYNIINRN